MTISLSEKITPTLPPGQQEVKKKIQISADWIMGRIQKGKNVQLRNAVIKGDLALRKLDLPIQPLRRTEFEKKLV